MATAAWASTDEISTFEAGQIWLGRLPDGRPVGVSDDRHVLLVSGTRGGKGVSSIIPNILQWPGSLVVIDPKGENAAIAASRRGQGSERTGGMDQGVFVLDPFNTARISDRDQKACFNPLDFLDPLDDETPDDAARIADALVVVSDKEPYWDQQARSLIKNLILHVITDEYFEGRRSLVTVRELIMQGDVAMVERLGGEEVDPFAMLYEGMKRNMAFNRIISGAGRTYAGLGEEAGKTMKQILSAADTHTAFIDSLPMQRVLGSTSPGMTIARLKTDPKGMSLFISLPQRYMETHAGWMRMMVSLIITEMERVPGQPATGHSILMCLDEFAGLKRMPIIENAAAQIAGFGVKLYLIVQNLVQLKTVYKDNWEVFLGNAGTKVFYSIDDAFTRNYLSKYMGEHEVARTTRTSSETAGRSTSKSVGSSRSEGSTWSDSDSSSWGTSQGRSSSRSRGTSSGGGMNFNGGVPQNPGTFWSPSSSDAGGWSMSNSSSDSDSRTTGDSFSETAGGSLSRSIGGSTSDGVSETFTDGDSESSTSGTAQGIHKRALLTPDEIGHVFARVEDPDNAAYPGLALVLVSGRRPFIVRRPKYYEDRHFAGTFDPHPDYPFTPLPEPLADAPPQKTPTATQRLLSPPSIGALRLPSWWKRLTGFQRHALIDAALLMTITVWFSVQDQLTTPDEIGPSKAAVWFAPVCYLLAFAWPLAKLTFLPPALRPLVSLALKLAHGVAYYGIWAIGSKWLTGR